MRKKQPRPWSTLVEGGKEWFQPPGKLTLELVHANQNKINFYVYGLCSLPSGPVRFLTSFPWLFIPKLLRAKDFSRHDLICTLRCSWPQLWFWVFWCAPGCSSTQYSCPELVIWKINSIQTQNIIWKITEKPNNCSFSLIPALTGPLFLCYSLSEWKSKTFCSVSDD